MSYAKKSETNACHELKKAKILNEAIEIYGKIIEKVNSDFNLTWSQREELSYQIQQHYQLLTDQVLRSNQ